MAATLPTIKSIQEIDAQNWSANAKEITQRYSEPVIVRGIAKTWPGGQWTPAFFAENYPDAEIEVYCGWSKIQKEYSKRPDFNALSQHKKTIKLLEHCQSMEGDPNYDDYAVDKFFFEKHPELKDQLKMPLEEEGGSGRYFFFIGAQSSKTRLHTHEFSDVFLAQLYGSKQVTLIGPQYREACYAKVNNHPERPHYVSPVDAMDPRLEEYPRFGEAVLLQAKLNPGDLLYLPRGWFHDVRALDASITVSKFID